MSTQINVMKEAHQFAGLAMSNDMEKMERAAAYALYYHVEIPAQWGSYREALAVGLRIAHKRAKRLRLALAPKVTISEKVRHFFTKTVADVKNTILASFLSHQA